MVLVLVIGPAWCADDVKPIKSGGHFDVEVVKDVAYDTSKDADPDKHKLDLYLPKCQKDFPVLFFVHGGSWRSGDKRIYGPIGSVFAENGIGAVIISYRLSPKVQHPAHIQDVARAFAWTCANIGKYGGRADQIFVSGHSAGGHLAALLATDETYLQAEKLSFANIKAAIPLSGVYVIRPTKNMEVPFGKDEEVLRSASPLTHVKGKHVPFLIIYADKDYATLDQGAETMGAALRKQGGEANVLKMADRDHISIIAQTRKADDPTFQAMLEFVAKHAGMKLTTASAQREP
jgi:acetyl esterase/lipase